MAVVNMGWLGIIDSIARVARKNVSPCVWGGIQMVVVKSIPGLDQLNSVNCTSTSFLKVSSGPQLLQGSTVEIFHGCCHYRHPWVFPGIRMLTYALSVSLFIHITVTFGQMIQYDQIEVNLLLAVPILCL